MSQEDVLLKQLDQARAEIAELRLRLTNSTMLLKLELTASGKLPKWDPESRPHPATQASVKN